MERGDYVQKRRGKYLAQTLEAFENDLLPLLPPEHRDGQAVRDFKALVRARFGALATDAVEIMSLDQTGEQINGVALDMRDSLSPVGRP